MNRVIFSVVLAALVVSAQHRPRLSDYAVVLEDEPVARKIASRAFAGAQARTHMARIEAAQSSLRAELARRHVPVTAADQVLVNALIVTASAETAAALRSIPGVKYVTLAPPARMTLDRAEALMNASAAWSAAPGGASNAGAGIKIGIIDSGIDQKHAGFQDPSLAPPAGFPKGDAAYTNGKVIVARSYVSTLAVGFFADPNNFAATSRPDDYTPRDRTGHGTAVAMIAAGTSNTGPLGTIQGIAPKAYLGNYKIFGSPGVNDFTSFAAFDQALKDALADGMDVVTLSLADAVFYGPLDTDPDPSACGGACDIYSQAVEAAVAAGMVVVVPAGNEGTLGNRGQALASIRRPGTAPSAITVGASVNSHAIFQSLHIGGTGVPSGLQNIHAVFSDGPHPSVPSAPIKDVSNLGNDGLACTAISAGALSGAIALIQRGTCDYTTKIVNAQNAGAIAAVIYQTSGIDAIDGSLFVQTTGIPSMMIGNSDGAALKAYLASNAATASLDPALTASDVAPNSVWASSSRGPSPGTFAGTATNVIKPELVAVGTNIYTATQKLDPNGAQYNSSGYTAVTGTSAAVPMVAGAVALVKQKNARLTPAQLKSAVVNTASSDDLTDASGVARVNSAGAGKLNLGAAVNAAAALEPATIEFGVIATASLPINRTLTIANVSSASAAFTLAVQQRDSDSRARVQVTPSTLTLAAGQQNSVTVSLTGTQPTAGSYEGFIVVTGGGSTLHLPYQYLVPTGTPADIYPINNGSFIGGVNESGWGISLRAVDSAGVPVINTPVQFTVIAGNSTLDNTDKQTFLLGNAGADLTLGSEGNQTFRASVGSMTLEFDGYARAFPAISANGVLNAASNDIGSGLAPGSYISIYGSALADATQIESTTSLPVSLSSVNVSFDADGISQPGHLHFVSPGQVNVQIPWEYQGKSSVKLKVTIGDLQSATYTLPLAAYSPGIFVASGVAAAEDAGFAVITPAHPAIRGQVVQLFVNGLGAVANQPASGEPSPGTSLATTLQTPTVTIGGVDAPVGFSGLTPGTVGLYQINATVPSGVQPGNQQIVVKIGGVDSKPSVIPIQ